MFVSGLGLAILAGVAGFFLYKHAQSRYTVFDIEDGIAMMESELDEVPPATVLKYYDVLNVDNGLGDWAEQPYVGENNQATILMNVSYGLFGLAGIGLILMIGGFLAPK